MKRALKFLPLLGLAAAGHFLGEFSSGARLLPETVGLLVSAFCFFLLPFVISVFFCKLIKVVWPILILIFICALAAQFALVSMVPSGATSNMMGIAFRLRREFSADQIRNCAEDLRQKKDDGKLTVKPTEKRQHSVMLENALVVDDLELPASLRGRFQSVFIQRSSVVNGEQVFFALSDDTGIVCDSRQNVREFFVYSIADGVHAYRYQRL